jgi:hypothetical protein
MGLHLFLSTSFYVFVPHPSSTMYCLGLFILPVLTMAWTQECQPGYQRVLCNCSIINQANAIETGRWWDAGAPIALDAFNLVWSNPPPELQNLPYVQALSAFFNGPESMYTGYYSAGR